MGLRGDYYDGHYSDCYCYCYCYHDCYDDDLQSEKNARRTSVETIILKIAKPKKKKQTKCIRVLRGTSLLKL